MRPHWTKAAREARRRHGVVLLQQGRGVREVAHMVGTSPSSVTRWKQAFERFGEAGLKAKPGPGSKPRLSEAQLKILPRLLLRGARWYGFSTDLWTLERVAEVIYSHFKVRYHPAHVWRLLRGLGWSCQKPERRARERDERTIRRWREVEWPRIKKKPAAKAAGCCFSTNPASCSSR